MQKSPMEEHSLQTTAKITKTWLKARCRRAAATTRTAHQASHTEMRPACRFTKHATAQEHSVVQKAQADTTKTSAAIRLTSKPGPNTGARSVSWRRARCRSTRCGREPKIGEDAAERTCFVAEQRRSSSHTQMRGRMWLHLKRSSTQRC